MNDNFLQENPMALFDDFVQIPNEAFDNAEDLNEIYALLDTICESGDYARVLSRIYDLDPQGFSESVNQLKQYRKNAVKGEYGEGRKKQMVIDFMDRTFVIIDDIRHFGLPFTHQEMKVCKIDKNAVLPKYKDPGDAGADIYNLEDVVIAPGETALVRTGIKVIVPGGFKLEIVPRSGLSLNSSMRIPNTPGTIDCGFRDELKVIVHNTGDTPIHYTSHSRIAQMILVPIYKIDWKEISAEEYANFGTDRGQGFGSSGIKD